MLQTLDRVVIQVDMGQGHSVLIDRVGVYSEAVVLRSDFDLTGAGLLDGLVCTSVAELKLVGLRS